MFSWKTLDDVFFEYEFYCWGEEQPQGKKKEFSSQPEARALLEWFLRDPFKGGFLLGFFREVLTNEPMLGRYWSSEMTDRQVLDRLAWELASGGIMMVERKKPYVGYWEPAAQPEKPTGQSTEPEVEQPPADSWVVVKLVDDATGLSATGIKLKIKFADGYQSEFPGGLTGKIDIRAIASGRCEINSQMQDAYIDDCYCYVDTGESPSDKKSANQVPGKTVVAQNQQLIQGSCLVEVKKHKVQDGETLERIAKDNDLTKDQLAFFNYNTKDSKKINQMLKSSVGCEKMTEDGKTYEFQSSDSPGFIYIPKPWTGIELDTGKEHTLRVKKLSPVICMDMEIDLDDPETKDDEISLETTDGSWKHIVPAKELEEVEENWVRLMFPMPPKGKKLNLIHDTKNEGEQYYIFQEATLEDIYSFNSEEQ